MAPVGPSRLGHYDVTALLGEGGMGQVNRATDTKIGRSGRPRGVRLAAVALILAPGRCLLPSDRWL